jgi:DNA-binding response OmpR family regulator
VSESILIVEDDPVLRDTLEYRLTNDGYDVLVAEDGYGAIEAARIGHPDVILLDVILPGIDGFEVCRLLRREMSTPIMMLTARTEEVDRVVGLEIGADDYITKPFSMRELLARIKVQVRHTRRQNARDPKSVEAANAELPEPAAGPLRFENLEIDLNRCEVVVDGQLLEIKPKEFELLASLAQHRGQVLSREQLLKAVWGWEHAGHSRTVDVHIRWLREKIEVDPGDPRRIITVRGMGYRFDG